MLKLLLTFLLTFGTYVHCLDNGLARTPPMGWLSWERYTCNIDCVTYPHDCINEQLYKDMADRIVADGYRDIGYEYVNIDDCWSEMERDPVTNRLVPDRKRFPSGMKSLADYMHSRGLKLGIYGDVGPKTCAGYPAQNGNGSGYFTIDAETFAEWGIDSFKFDGCNEDPHQFDVYYPIMGRALNATGSKILFSCEWPLYQFYAGITPNYTAITQTCNLFRNHGDIDDSWDTIQSIIDFYAQYQDQFVKYNGPGQWFDPDMIVVGDFGLSYDQSRAQLAMWSIWSSPLYMSNDLRHIRKGYEKLLKNSKVIAVNQDPLGIMGKRVYSYNSFEVWVKPVLPIINNVNSYAIVYLNRNNLGDETYFSLQLSTLIPTVPATTNFIVYDLFDDGGSILGHLSYNQSLDLLVDVGGAVRMVKLVPMN